MENFPWDNWKVEEGTLKTLVHEKGVDIISKEKYKDFELTRMESSIRGKQWNILFC